MSRVYRRLPPSPVRKGPVQTAIAMVTGRARRLLGAGLVLATGSGIAMNVSTGGSAASTSLRVPPVAAGSWLKGSTLLTVYGRGFGIAPILGRLGSDRSVADFARQVAPYARAVATTTGGRHVRTAIHLIYGLATSCSLSARCLSYLDDQGTDIVQNYIKPAAQRGWLVILDDQLGRSTPARELRRMIRRGYLAYDNVEVAFDPEFRMISDQSTPGVPVGSVSSEEINRAESELDQYVASRHLPHSKLMLVHQWSQDMIPDRNSVRDDFRYVQPVITMDAIGAPEDKANTYNTLLGPGTLSPGIGRGIKLFLPSPFEPPGTIDSPSLTWNQIFDRPTSGGGNQTPYLQAPPQVVVVT